MKQPMGDSHTIIENRFGYLGTSQTMYLLGLQINMPKVKLT
jgi:hypothetical protein